VLAAHSPEYWPDAPPGLRDMESGRG
jgi:hypothetical protein